MALRNSVHRMLIAAACFLIYYCTGTTKSNGLVVVAVLDEFGTTTADTGIISSFLTAGLCLASFPGALLVAKFGCRAVSIGGGLLTTLGFVGSYLARSTHVLKLTYSAMGGVGLGLQFVPVAEVLNREFGEQTPRAFAFVMTAIGLSAVTFPYMLRFLLDEYGLNGAMLLWGGLLLHVCVSGSLFSEQSLTDKAQGQRKEEEEEARHIVTIGSNTLIASMMSIDVKATQRSPTSRRVEEASETTKQSLRQKLGEKLAVYHFLNWPIVGMMAGLGNGTFCFVMLNSIIQHHGRDLGMDGTTQATMTTLTGIGDIAGRLTVGLLSRRLRAASPFLALAALTATFGGGYVALVWVRSVPAVMGVVAMIGLAGGAYNAQWIPCLTRLARPEHFGTLYGVGCILQGLFSLTLPPLLGYLRDVTADYRVSLGLLAGLSLLSAAVFIARGCLGADKEPPFTQDREEDDDDNEDT